MLGFSPSSTLPVAAGPTVSDTRMIIVLPVTVVRGPVLDHALSLADLVGTTLVLRTAMPTAIGKQGRIDALIRVDDAFDFILYS